MKETGAIYRSAEELVTITMEQLGGRAPIDDVVEQLHDVATNREWQSMANKAVRLLVRSLLRSRGKKGRLPAFYAVGGEYVALSLFTFDDYVEKARSLARLSRANKDKVLLLAEVCLETHGHSFDADQVLRDAGVAA